MTYTERHTSKPSFDKQIDLIERHAHNLDTLKMFLVLINDPTQRAIFSGLLKIKQDIGDRSLKEYLRTRREEGYQHLLV